MIISDIWRPILQTNCFHSPFVIYIWAIGYTCIDPFPHQYAPRHSNYLLARCCIFILDTDKFCSGGWVSTNLLCRQPEDNYPCSIARAQIIGVVGYTSLKWVTDAIIRFYINFHTRIRAVVIIEIVPIRTRIWQAKKLMLTLQAKECTCHCTMSGVLIMWTCILWWNKGLFCLVVFISF